MDTRSFGATEAQMHLMNSMRNSNKFSKASKRNISYMNFLYPSGTRMMPFCDQPSSPHPKMSQVHFPKEWVPKEITVVREPTFKFFVPATIRLWNSAELSDVDDLSVVKTRIGRIRERHIFERTFKYERPLREDDEMFEWQVKEAMSQLLIKKHEDEKILGVKELMFLLRLSEKRLEMYGYLPNRAMISAWICTFAEER